MFALSMGMFTANLDSTILATAIPYFANEFHSIDDIGWYGSATFLKFAAFQTTWGKAFKYFHLTWSYLLSLFIFELGSLICAVAPNSATLIVGRAIAGTGGVGLCTGTFAIIGYTVASERQSGFMWNTEGSFIAVDWRERVWTGKKLVFANGVLDIFPDITGYGECWGLGM